MIIVDNCYHIRNFIITDIKMKLIIINHEIIIAFFNKWNSNEIIFGEFFYCLIKKYFPDYFLNCYYSSYYFFLFTTSYFSP